MQIDQKTLAAARNTRPTTPDALWNWIFLHAGVRVARCGVCRGHHAPFDAISCWFLDRPTQALCLGARGSGKSFLSGIETHLSSRFYPRHSTRILGGSEAQSKQIYAAIDEAVLQGEGPAPFYSNDRDTIRHPGKELTLYRNGSDVQILTASPKSVRGAHVPSLKLDEVDEIDPDIRQSAMGMNMDKHGYRATCVMTSTWHNVGGPMGELIDAAKEEGWPFHAFCSFEVLERCPESRSGPWVGGEAGYEKCPECPLKQWCHSERDVNGDRPLAKISRGHYGIDSLIQKTTLAKRVFAADYLCRGPRVEGLWFQDFNVDLVRTEDAEYNPNLDVHFAIDTGVRTGAVWFQVKLVHNWYTGQRDAEVNVFADYFAEFLTPEVHVNGEQSPERTHRGIKAIAEERCRGRMDKRWTDPAGKARNASGTIVIGQFAQAGLPLEAWPKAGIKDALALVESLLSPANGQVRLKIHPRCVHLINALMSYRRACVKGVFVDHPEEPQHPSENLVDPLKNGLVAVIGLDGLAPTPVNHRVHPGRVF